MGDKIKVQQSENQTLQKVHNEFHIYVEEVSVHD